MRLTPDTEYVPNTGAIAKAGDINKADRELPFDGGRAVEGGTAFAFQLDRQGAMPRNRSPPTRASQGWAHRRHGEGMASLFLGDINAVRLSGPNTPHWGKDRAIFMEEVLAWFCR
jgi:hypothetical protein